MANILFVCSMGRLRSRTAAAVLQSVTHPVRYAGTDIDADKRLTVDDIKWADNIICMERCHRSKVRRRLKGQSGKISVWNIPDEYEYLDTALCIILKRKYEELYG